MKLDDYIAKVTEDIAKGVRRVQQTGINITPHLHEEIRGTNDPARQQGTTAYQGLPYGNSHHLLLPVEIEVTLTDKGEVAAELPFFSALGARITRARTHRARVNFWIELTSNQPEC